MSIATQIVPGSNLLPLGKCTGIKKTPAIVNCRSPLFLQRSRLSAACRYRSGVDRKKIAGVVLASSGDGVETKVETEQFLSGEWPENFSMLNFEDLSSYFEPMIFKEEAQPEAFLFDVMSKAIYIARPDQLLEEIDNNFESVTGLPVVDKDLKCIGVISKKDKAKASKGVQERKIRKVCEMNAKPLTRLENGSLPGTSPVVIPRTTSPSNGIPSQFINASSDSFPLGGIPSLRLPTVAVSETSLVARCRRIYGHAHDYHINSISNNRDLLLSLINTEGY